MVYENEEQRQEILDTLNTRVSSISLCVLRLLEQGYLPNERKKCLLSLAPILIDAYNNILIFNEDQQASLDKIYEFLINNGRGRTE